MDIPNKVKSVAIIKDKSSILKKFEEKIEMGILNIDKLIIKIIINCKDITIIHVTYVEKKKVVLFVGLMKFLKYALDVFSIITKLDPSKIAMNIITNDIKLGKK